MIFAATLILPPPARLPLEGWRTLGLALLMAVWWTTEGTAGADEDYRLARRADFREFAQSSYDERDSVLDSVADVA